jgi:hypothetical protein
MRGGNLKFSGDSGFHEEVKRRVLEYFQHTGLSPRDSPRMYVKTAALLLWFVASYAWLVFAATTWWQGVLLSFSLFRLGARRPGAISPVVGRAPVLRGNAQQMFGKLLRPAGPKVRADRGADPFGEQLPAPARFLHVDSAIDDGLRAGVPGEVERDALGFAAPAEDDPALEQRLARVGLDAEFAP